jgi:Flp pilus assembly protein TadG
MSASKTHKAARSAAEVTRPGARRCDAGSAAAEIVILAPLLVLLALLFVTGGRLADGIQEIGDAARTSVDSAVIASTAPTAEAGAAATAGYEISHDGLHCTTYSLTADVVDFAPGGAVSVQIHCDLGLAMLGIPGFPDSVTLSGHASGGIEPYRELG